MYQVHYDAETGAIKGFYLLGLHAVIPAPYIDITIKQHADFFARGQNHRVIDGIWTYVEPPEPEPVVVTPEVNKDVADIWEAMLAMSAEIETLKGGA